eukprot:Sspe_Gene.8284::Locus_2824_Transcript_1_1_Confidence_1.000_Length_2212::g.8284::m.8284
MQPTHRRTWHRRRTVRSTWTMSTGGTGTAMCTTRSLRRGAGSSAWSFAQFDVLNYVVELVDMIPPERRGDVRLVAREMTWLLNSAGNSKGVIYGRWDGWYWFGKRPTEWTGSRAILKQWSESGHSPVRYGQCWVFACVC